MLLVVLLFVDDNVAVDEDVVEKKELPRFRFLPACLGQDSLANQDSSRH